MKLIIENDKFMNIIDEDVKINKETILNDIERHPYLLNKYVKRLNIVSTKLKYKKIDFERVYAERYKYYKEKYDPVLSSGTEINAYTRGDSEVHDIQKEINVLESNLNMLKDSVEMMKQKYFTMKLYLDYKTYLDGDRI